MAFSNPALEKRLQTIGGSKPQITGSLVKTTPTQAPTPRVTGFSNPALEKRIQTIVTTPVKKASTTPVKVVSAPKKQPTLLDNASAFLAKIPAPAGIPQAVFGAVKGLDFERLKSAITAGAKTIPGTTKIAGGIIAENWAKQQKQMNSFFGILPKEFEPLFGNKLANMVTEPAANKANIVAPKLREQGQISQKKAVEPYAKLGPAKGNTQKIAEAVAFNLPQMALSTGLTVATSLLTKNPQLATAVGMSTSYGMGASEIYNTARENGLTDKQALPYATMGGAVVGALDFVPLNRLIGKTTGASKVIEQSIIKKITSEIFSVGTQAGFEGITEGLQEIVGNAIEGTYKEHTDLFKGVALSTVVGALLGGGTDVALTTALHIGGKGESIEEVSNQVNQKIETALNKPESKRTAEEKLIVENVLTTQVSPDEALDIVTTSKLENTDQGKEIVKSVLQAKNEGQDIKITTDEGHDIVKVELVSPNYIRPVSIPEDIPQDSSTFEYTPAKNLTPEEQKVETNLGTKISSNYDATVNEYIQKFGNVLNTDNARELSSDYAATNEFMGPAIEFMEQVKADIDEKLITAREVPAVVEKIKDGSKVVVKPANETPIGTNIQKDSRLYKRISEVAEGAIKEELDSRSVTYNTLDLEKQKKIVTDLITENPEKAIDMAKGLINTPEGVTRNAISMGLYEAAREADTNLSASLLTDTSLRSTRLGQEIVSLRGDALGNPSLNAARQVISSRIESVVKRYNDTIKGLVADDAPNIKKFDALVKHEAKKVKKIVTAQQKRIQSAQDIINALTCK